MNFGKKLDQLLNLSFLLIFCVSVTTRLQESQDGGETWVEVQNNSTYLKKKKAKWDVSHVY